jgi:amidase
MRQDQAVSTFISRSSVGSGMKVAIKDLIDIRGEVTSAGCRAVAETAAPASADAACVGEIRRLAEAGRVEIVGKTNLHELAFGTTGVNDWSGTPVNPLDPALIPGGSSSGSAVAVAEHEADVALGSDTGGSVRIPSACCGTAGLKTTWGRISLEGVVPLASSLDTIGPMARNVAGLVSGMQLLEPGFEVGGVPEGLFVHRLRLEADPLIEAAVDAALGTAELASTDVPDPGWHQAWVDGGTLLMAENWRANRELVEQHSDRISPKTLEALKMCATATAEQEQAARAAQVAWTSKLEQLVGAGAVVALPTLDQFPPSLDDPHITGSRLALPINLAGLPALSIPIPSDGALPASLQLVGPRGGEELLLAVGARVEAAVS